MKEESTARICVPVCVKRIGEVAPAIARAAEYGDVIELRLDCFGEAEFNEVERELTRLCRVSVRPIIFTLRPTNEGGKRDLDLRTRLRFWFHQGSELLQGDGNYADIEVDIANGLAQSEQSCSPIDWSRTICSHHDFARVPEDLEQIYERMVATKACVLKIAVQADDITDCIPVLRLLERARSEGREMIAIAMGQAGLLTRILGPSRGAFLTYGSLDGQLRTAPGQISASDLRDLYRIHTLNERTEIMGLAGEHVMHSVSPRMHNTSFSASGLNSAYIPFEVRALDDFVRRMVHPRTREIEWNLRGLSITAPHKIAIMKHLDWIDPIATEIGAVNTVVIENNQLMGYNTDAEAAIAPLRLHIVLDGARVAVIGAGGASRSLLWGLRNAGAHATVFARDVERAKVTAKTFGAECETLDGAIFGEFQIVVNATPIGTRGIGEEASPAKASQLRGAEIAYDLVYNPLETRFMREAREAGCRTIGGLQMLVAQAAQQFKIWTGKDAPFEVMRNAATEELRK